MSLLSRVAARLLECPPRRGGKVLVQKAVGIPMRDGVTLLADRWFSEDAGHAPVVLMRSPYGRAGMFSLIAQLFAERGFQFISQSCRGTSGSGGTLNPMRQERADGLDTLEWIRAQPWFAGQLYTYGGSYLGYAQWAMAKEAGDRIDGMALSVTLSNFKNETLAFGGFTQEGSLEWTRQMAAHRSIWRQLLFGSSRKAELQRIHAHLPLQELDQLALGKRIPWWQDWVGHGEPTDTWWDEIDHSADVADVKIPVAMLGGWRDIFLPWQIKDFEAMQAKGRDAWLTIGPWAHASLGGMREHLRQALGLFSAHSRGSPVLPDRDRVRLYITGAEQWRDYPSWPPPGSRWQRLCLQPSARLSPAPPSTTSDPTEFIYDPSDPTPALHGPRVLAGARKPDMSLLERRSDTVSFTSAPLTTDIEAVGPVNVELFVRSDRQHTDFYACLCDVDDADRPLHVVDGYRRLRGGDPPEDTNGLRRVIVACWPTGHRFRRGHRLRLILASGAHPRYARNLGTGEPLGTGTRMLVARQQIFHDELHSSALYLTTRDRAEVF